jgi:DegV family protein with EDD domain
MIRLITDSSADLPKELIDKYNISVVPLIINLEGKEYLEGVNISPQEFFDKMFASKELPKTSQPSPLIFANTFKELANVNDELICLTISSGLSGTYQSALLGTELSNVKVTVFDTLGGSLAHGIQLIKVAQLIEKGFTMDYIVDKLIEYRENTNILILLDNLTNIVKGGRLTKFQGSIASILNIKLLLEGVHGKVELLEKIRGRKKFLKRVLDIIAERKEDFSHTIFGITHTGNIEDAEFLKEEIIKRFKPKEVIINYMGATMGTYAGENGMILSFC